MPDPDKVPQTCPHCGRDLSPWEQVLLSVDRALMCKSCWYRIILDVVSGQRQEHPPADEDRPGEG